MIMGDIQESIQTLARTGNEIYARVCEVLTIDTAARTIDVKPLDNAAEIYGVPLQADTQGEGLVSFPKKGSRVLVVFTGKHTAVVCNVSLVDRLLYSQDGLFFELDSEQGMIKMGNDSTSLLQLFSDLKSLIQNLKVNTPAGPSTGLLPDSMQALERLETDFKTLFK